MAESTRDASGNVTQVRYADHAGHAIHVDAPNPQTGRMRIGVTPAGLKNPYMTDLEPAEVRRLAQDMLDLAPGGD